MRGALRRVESLRRVRRPFDRTLPDMVTNVLRSIHEWHSRRRARAQRHSVGADDIFESILQNDLFVFQRVLPTAPINKVHPEIGVTPLMLAVILLRVPMVEAILERKPDLKLESAQGCTAAEFAFASGLSYHPLATRLFPQKYHRHANSTS